MTEEIDLNQLIMGERKSLHDISNQLVVAQGMSSFVLKALKKFQEEGNEVSKEIERMDKNLKAIQKITAIVQERRALLHSHGQDKN